MGYVRTGPRREGDSGGNAAFKSQSNKFREPEQHVGDGHADI
jgi:hypothetical protein